MFDRSVQTIGTKCANVAPDFQMWFSSSRIWRSAKDFCWTHRTTPPDEWVARLECIPTARFRMRSRSSTRYASDSRWPPSGSQWTTATNSGPISPGIPGISASRVGTPRRAAPRLTANSSAVTARMATSLPTHNLPHARGARRQTAALGTRVNHRAHISPLLARLQPSESASSRSPHALRTRWFD